MGQILKVNGDYNIKVVEGSTITLDTGLGIGDVIVTGDLTVRGVTTSIESTDLVIEDNLITLNKGELGAGITLETSGIEIDRGLLSNVSFLFNENYSWYNSDTAQTENGAWTFVDALGRLGSLYVADLSTQQLTFNLINTTATTVNFAGDATNIQIGAATGTTNVNNNLDVDGDVNIDGNDLTTSSTTFNLLNTTATTVNFAGTATNIQIGAATGTTNVNNNLDVDGDVNIDGGDLTVSTGTFNLANTTATTVNFAGAATSIVLGATSGTTRVRNNLDVDGDVNIDGGDLTVSTATFNLANTTATTVNFAGAATDIQIGAATGTTNVNNNLDVDGDVNIDGNDLTTSSTTFNLLNTTATTVNFAGTAIDVQIGASTGTTSVNNNLDVDGDVTIDGGDLLVTSTTFNLANVTATTLNIGGAATDVQIGAATGTTNVNNNLDVDGDVNIDGGDLTVSTGTFNLANTTATTVNFAGAATDVQIGAATGTTNVNNNLVVDLDVAVNGGDLTTTATTFNLVNTNATTVNLAGAGTSIVIGAATGTTRVRNNLDVDGDVNIDGGDLTVSTSTFNLANTIATTVNFAGAASTINIGTSSGVTNINSITIDNNSIGGSVDNTLAINSVLNLANQIEVPPTPTGYVSVYSTNVPGTGGTGLYFVNTEGTNDELISKTKAILYSLIF